MASSAGLSNRVHVLDFVEYERLREVLPSADLGLAIYRRESDLNKIHQATASVKLMEYFAAGIPAVASNAPDFAAVADVFGGISTATTNEPAAIAAAIRQAFASDERYKELSCQALRAHREVFHYERQYAEVLLIMDEAKGSSR